MMIMDLSPLEELNNDELLKKYSQIRNDWEDISSTYGSSYMRHADGTYSDSYKVSDDHIVTRHPDGSYSDTYINSDGSSYTRHSDGTYSDSWSSLYF